MSRLIDLTGQRFGRLKVISEAGRDKIGRALWLCLCDCGNKKIVKSACLRFNGVKSCGCLRRDIASKKTLSHGHSIGGMSPTYIAWKNLKSRCCNPKHKSYKDYGGRGITVCTRWLKFENFLEDMGEQPNSLTIERINNDKGYFLENCEWASMKKQNRNSRGNHLVQYQGKTKCIAEWAEDLGLNYYTLYSRLEKYSPQIAFNM